MSALAPEADGGPRAGGTAAAGLDGHGRRFTLKAAGRVELAVTAFAPSAAGDRGAVVIAGATGVPQGFYRGFAAWLAAQGVAAYTFDYRGVARSRPARLRGFEAAFPDWADDIDAVLAHALAAHARVGYVGHSIGGFLGPTAALATRLERLLLVGAQTAYWRDWPQPQRWPMALLWHGAMPLVTGLVGYFPGRTLRLGEDLPRGIAMQWALRPWRDPFDDPRARALYARALPPVHLLAPRDDVFATAPALQRVQQRLAGAADVRRHVIDPALLGLRRIGHFGVFRPAASAVWPLLRDLALPPAAATPGLSPVMAGPAATTHDRRPAGAT